MSANARVFVLVLASALARPAVAYCPWDGNNPPLAPTASETAYIFSIDDDGGSHTAWDTLFEDVDLSSSVFNRYYYKAVVPAVIDASLQAWARRARVPVKVGVGAMSSALSASNDSTSAIVVDSSHCNGGTSGDSVLYSNDTADIVFKPDCGTFRWERRLDTDGTSTVSTFGIRRLIRHEMGHVLGLGHTCLTSSPTTTNCCGKNAENVCESGPLMVAGGTRETMTDAPHGDEVEGIHEYLRSTTTATTCSSFDCLDAPGDDPCTGGNQCKGDPRYCTTMPSSLIPRREVVLVTARISSGDAYSEPEASQNTGLYSVYPARLDCRSGTGITPDCVVLRAWTETDIRFNALSFASNSTTASFGTTHTTTVSTRGAPDIAYSHATSGVTDLAIGVAAETYPHDDPFSASDNSIKPIAVHVYTNLAGTPSATSFALGFSTDNYLTYSEPRIAFVRSLGSTSCGSCAGGAACIDGACPSEGRFVIMSIRRDNIPRFFISNVPSAGNPINDATDWTVMSDANESTPSGGSTNFEKFMNPMDPLTSVIGHAVIENFDIHCPTHTTTAGTADDHVCRIVFRPEREEVIKGEVVSCSVRFSFVGFPAAPQVQVLGCTTTGADTGEDEDTYYDYTGFGGAAGNPVHLADYGTGTASQSPAQRTTRSWLLSTSLADPHDEDANSFLGVWGQGSTNVFASGDMVSSPSREFDFDRYTCVALDSEDDARSYIGGPSVDYAEDAHRIIWLGWGYMSSDDVPDGNCF